MLFVNNPGIWHNYNSLTIKEAGQFALNLNKKMIKISDLITKAWDFYRKNFKLLLPIIIILFLVSTLESVIRSFVYQPDDYVGIYVIGMIISIPFYLAMLWLTVVMIEFLARMLKGEKAALESIYKIALKKLPMAILISLLVGLAVVGGTLLLIIPGIIFAIWFNFSIYTYVLEGKTGTEAMKESKILVKGRWWPVFWRLALLNIFWGLVTSAIIFGISSIVRFPFGDLTKLSANAYEGLRLLISLITDATFSLSTPLIILGSLLLFMDLRESRSLTVKKDNLPAL